MGGRGGAPSATNNSPTRSLAINPSQEYREWFNNPRDIPADSINPEAKDIDQKVNMLLPDRDATLQFNGTSWTLRDMQTDEVLQQFTSQRITTVYRRVAAYYGKRVEYVDKRGTTHFFGKNAADLSKTPAARKYGMSR